jgi:hypothetical protein
MDIKGVERPIGDVTVLDIVGKLVAARSISKTRSTVSFRRSVLTSS